MAKLKHLFLLVPFLLMTSNTQASIKPVIHNLAVSININQGKLSATSRIELPSQESTEIYVDGLIIESLFINGNDTDLASIETSIISLPKTDFDQEIIIKYELSCAGSDSGSCMINDSAAILTGRWHPALTRDAIYKLTAKIPADFSAVSEADEIITTIDGNIKTVEFDFPYPVKSINFIAGPYKVEEEIFGDGQKILSYFYPEDQQLAASYREKTRNYLQRFSDLIGPYPFKRFAIVENRLPTGYAMPTFTLLGQSVIRLPFIVDTSLGHEVLHSWFGNAVRTDRGSGNWCEGLTTYLADHAFTADKGEDLLYRKGQLIKYQSYVSSENSISLNEFIGASLDRSRKQQANRAIGYGKTSMVFHMLHEKFGQELFIKALNDFFNRMRGKVADWQDIQTSFEDITSSELDDFFEQWLTRKDIPAITVKELKLTETDGRLQVSFTIHQETETPYNLNIPVIMTTKEIQINKTVTISEQDTPVEIPLASYPTGMVIDPDYVLMRKLHPSELPPVWSNFAGTEKSMAIVGSPNDFDLFEPLIEILEAQGTEILAADEVTDKELTDNSIIFLGASGVISRGLFAQPQHEAEGFTIDIRKNPLNHDHTAILVSSASKEETAKGAVKLRHYGKYSFLHFIKGRAITKKITQSSHGLRYGLDEEPTGVQVQATLNFETIINDLINKQVIYVGEAHTRYEDHKLQLRIIRELFNRDPNLAIGMEMFPRSAQQTLDSFINGEIDEKLFLEQSHYFKVWSYDYRLYREIINFARQNKVRIIGLNIDKDKVSKVYKDGGISSLSPEEKVSVPIDRDLDIPFYRERINAVFSIHPHMGGVDRFAGFLQAQAIWDETMAESVANYLQENQGGRMVVLAGKGHVVKENAIPPRVNRRLKVDQSIVVSSDGGALYPPELDYVIFPPPAKLPPPVLIGIIMKEDKENSTVIIDGLSPHGGAKKAGIRKDDIILKLDDEQITTVEKVKILMVFKQKGDKIKLNIKRPHSFFPDEELEFEIEL